MRDKKEERKYRRANRKIASGNPKKVKKYGYNYAAAEEAGITPDETGHWPSRNPETGEILKGRKHPTISKTKKAEKALGYKIVKSKSKTLYSFLKEEKDKIRAARKSL